MLRILAMIVFMFATFANTGCFMITRGAYSALTGEAPSRKEVEARAIRACAISGGADEVAILVTVEDEDDAEDEQLLVSRISEWRQVRSYDTEEKLESQVVRKGASRSPWNGQQAWAVPCVYPFSWKVTNTSEVHSIGDEGRIQDGSVPLNIDSATHAAFVWFRADPPRIVVSLPPECGRTFDRGEWQRGEDLAIVVLLGSRTIVTPDSNVAKTLGVVAFTAIAPVTVALDIVTFPFQVAVLYVVMQNTAR